MGFGNNKEVKKMSMEAKKNLKRLVCAGIAILTLARCASANLVDSNSVVFDGIEYYIQANKSVYDLGEDVEMLYRVTNLRDEDVKIPCLRSPEFNLWVQEDDETIWALVHWFKWYSLGVDLSAGESKEIPYVWDMRDDNGNLVEPRVYDVVGVIYSYEQTEVKVAVTIVPEPCSLALLGVGFASLLAIIGKKGIKHL